MFGLEITGAYQPMETNLFQNYKWNPVGAF
jgi:hypothetical protein